MTPRRTGYCWDERCLAHDNGSMILNERVQPWLEVAHVERPERLARTHQILERSGVLAQLEQIPAREASYEEIELVHPREMIDKVREACESGELVWVGPEARVGPSTWQPALLALGGTLEAVDAVLDGRVRNAYVNLRPPGHHSTADTPMGFCIFNLVAVAARHAQRRGLERVAIVDWDVHHGNGTHDIFYADPSVLFVSLHQDGLYPENYGRLEQTGEGEGDGFTINIPLPAGAGDDAYLTAFDSLVLPALREFGPQFVLVSAGQDPSASDPLGRMSVTSEGFRGMAQRLVDLAEELCEGHLVVVQEGGYSLDHQPIAALAVVEALAGLDPLWQEDPLEIDVPRELREADRVAIEAAAEAHSARWPVRAPEAQAS
jgi:acetoin utilization deacetylase AcuC-like enzyme